MSNLVRLLIFCVFFCANCDVIAKTFASLKLFNQ